MAYALSTNKKITPLWSLWEVINAWKQNALKKSDKKWTLELQKTRLKNQKHDLMYKPMDEYSRARKKNEIKQTKSNIRSIQYTL